MKNQFVKLLTMFVSLIFITVGAISTVNATVKLTLIDGKKFTDYEVTDQTRKRSLQTIQKDLSKLFSKVSTKHLADNETMEVDITNIDLPGIYQFAYGHRNADIRIVRSHTPFKLYFSYRIKNTEGKIVKEGEHKIKEFFDSGILSRQHSNLGTVSYYERPLKKWFKVTFAN